MNTFSKENLEEILIKVETIALKDSKNDMIFTFEDIIYLDNRAITHILRVLDNDTLLKALKGSSPALQELFFRNMSEKLGEQLKDEFEYSCPVPLTSVLEARDKIMKIVEELAKSGEITIYKGPVV